MAHDHAEVRTIVTDLDRIIAQVRKLADRPEMQPDAAHALDDLRVARHRLKDIGHDGRFDTPEPDDAA